MNSQLLVMDLIASTLVMQFFKEQAETEVVPSSSLVEVLLRLRLGLGLRLGVVKVSDQDLVQHIKS